MLYDIGSIYGVQLANYVLPLVTVPYLSRVLGPASWGLFAMAQAFALYGGLIVEYGFLYYGTRRIATAGSNEEIANTVAGVSGAKALLSALVVMGAYASSFLVPLFAQHPRLLWSAVCSEIARASLPNYYFYGLKRIAVASTIDISTRVTAAGGIFIFVHKPEDAWRVFALQVVGALVALVVGHWMIYSRHAARWPRLKEAWRMLREAADMFLFRSAHYIYVLGNAFVLGLFAPAQAVGYYAGAEKINSAAVGLLSPLSTALYPHSAGLVKTSLPKAARLTKLSLYTVGASSILLAAVMWLGAPFIVRIILGPQFAASASVLSILSLRAPVVAWTNVLGFQWLLALGLEKPFQKITVIALVLNVLLATAFAPRYTFNGMAWAVVISQTVAATGIYIVLRRRNLDPFRMRADATYA